MKTHLILSFCTALIYCASCSNDTEQIIEPQAPKLNVNDSLAIVDIWEKADGKNWANKWDLSDISTWNGARLSLDEEKNEYRISELYINNGYSSKVDGIISPRIGELSALRALSIENIGIKGRIPTSIENLTKLESLTIFRTSIRDTLPACIFDLENLKSINITNNPLIYGQIPANAANTAQQIYPFYLINCGLTGHIPSGIKADAIWLDGNKFHDYPFEYLAPGQPTLHLKENQLTGSIPDSILNNPRALDLLRYTTQNQQKGFGFTNKPEDWR